MWSISIEDLLTLIAVEPFRRVEETKGGHPKVSILPSHLPRSGEHSNRNMDNFMDNREDFSYGREKWEMPSLWLSGLGKSDVGKIA